MLKCALSVCGDEAEIIYAGFSLCMEHYTWIDNEIVIENIAPWFHKWDMQLIEEEVRSQELEEAHA